ncbi:unnamed protein product [Ostreobium quekettii]|uniref:Uncharacterized protein n=1 Tax=Ostreobium quekettii TaxID=121088 RepID=A0A8S1J7E8_9CHLO|nr:unnamed protein product [Ostreobium quekettii]|eukprot:evm.model.scf_735EXC.2 EVM.evm.TU.scf_735EXC.2   scf_735EXC:9016-12278(+)
MDGSQSALVHSSPAVEIGQFGGLKDEVEALKRDKNVLMLELVRLRQQQQWTDSELRGLVQRVNVAESRQVEMLHLFSRFLQNPGLLSQMLQAANKRMERVGGGTSGRRKRRNRGSDVTMDGVDGAVEKEGGTEDNQLIEYKPPSAPGQDYSDALLNLLDTLTHGTAFKTHSPSQNSNPGHTEFGPSIPLTDARQVDPLASFADLSSPSAGTELERAGLALGIPVGPSSSTSNQPSALEASGVGPSMYSDLANLQAPGLTNASGFPFTSLPGGQPDIVFPSLDNDTSASVSGAVGVPMGQEASKAMDLASAGSRTAFNAEDGQSTETPTDGYGMITPFTMGSTAPISAGFAPPNGHDLSMDLPDSLPSLKSAELMMLESESLHNSFQKDDSLWKEFLTTPEESCGLESLNLEDQAEN